LVFDRLIHKDVNKYITNVKKVKQHIFFINSLQYFCIFIEHLYINILKDIYIPDKVIRKINKFMFVLQFVL